MRQSTFALKLAGAAALAGSTQAYGQIVNLTLPTGIALPTIDPTDPSATVFTSENYSVQPSSSIGPDFNFGVFFGNPSYLSTAVYSLKTGNGIAGTTINGYFYASALSTGTKIGSDTLTFETATLTTAYPGILTPFALLAGSSYGTTIGNDQPSNTPVYIGFQFADGLNNIHDGWLELNSTISGDPNSPGGMSFIAGAYNSVADIGDGAGDILVGQSAPVVPEPGTLSSLVLGAVALGGIGLLRRRRASLVAAKN